MALTACPDCGHEVSSAAKACPGCGRSQDQASNVIAGILIVVVGIVVFLVVLSLLNGQV